MATTLRLANCGRAKATTETLLRFVATATDADVLVCARREAILLECVFVDVLYVQNDGKNDVVGWVAIELMWGS